MEKELTVGVLKENKNSWEKRAPLTPSDVNWLVRKGIEVEVESNPLRSFGDHEYKKAGATIVKKFEKAELMVGIKEPLPGDILEGRTYMIFSHTMKGQAHNMPLLREFLAKKSTLIDYEKITDASGSRLVYFGRFAGICGLADSLHYFGRKLEWKGISNPFGAIEPAWKCGSLEELKSKLEQVKRDICNTGFDERIMPFIIGVTGCGNVSKGVHETLDILDPVEIAPQDLEQFIKQKEYSPKKIYKVALFREEKFRAKNGKPFTFEEYLATPEEFESNLDKYLPYFNMLIHTSYWEEHYPRLVSKDMIRGMFGKKDFRLDFIGDISCDIEGSIEVTSKTTTQDNAVFTYDPLKDRSIDGYESDGITVLAVDNLPAELPKDASEFFSGLVRDYIYQVASHGSGETLDSGSLAQEVNKAVIATGGHLTEGYSYLEEHLR